jgi:penicillin-binding protein 1B
VLAFHQETSREVLTSGARDQLSEGIVTGWRELPARGRAAAARAWALLTWRRVAVVCGALMLAGMVAVGTEALVRAHLPGTRGRMASALYTRPVPWGAGRAVRVPVAISALDGAPLEERTPVPLSAIPNRLVQAVIAVEDQRFYQHHGIDLRRIGGALVANIRARGIVQGGSTLTQQLAKNLFLTASRTPLRKVREAALAIVLEKRYTKDQILEAYLNEIYLGQDGARPIHGVGAAARYYFGKDVRKLTLPEAAELAATINAPNRNAASRHPEVAQQRRDLVLQLMADQHRISQAAADQAKRVDVSTRIHPAATFDGRNFRDAALDVAGRRVPGRGEAIYTTLDANLQRAAERAMAIGLARLRDDGVQGALVAIDPRTGDVLAMVGGRDYGATQFNRATNAVRQPGSAFKPIVALAALARNGDHAPAFTLASVVQDEPLSVETSSGPWEPADYDGEYRGPVTVREAMEQSLNVPFARIGLAVGPEQIVATARRVGITSKLDPVPSIALGSSGVTLLELVRAYGVLATGGDLAPTRMVLGHASYGDSTVLAPEATTTRVVDPAVAFLVTSALEGVVERGTGAAISALGHDGAIAGKTGTSNEGRDAWFVAYSSSLVVGVWVGYDDSRDLHMTGAAAALPIVSRFLAEATSSDDWNDFTAPDGVVAADTGPTDGDWGAGCGTREYFLAGTEPPEQSCDQMQVPQNDNWGRDAGRALLRFLQQKLRGLRGGMQ